MPNRVAKLESTVAQLSATVDGLREELVDANERIRALEREIEEEETANSDEGTPFLLPPQPGSNDDGSETESPKNSADDIIVA